MPMILFIAESFLSILFKILNWILYILNDWSYNFDNLQYQIEF